MQTRGGRTSVDASVDPAHNDKMATTWTDVDPQAFLEAVTPASRRRDAMALLDLMRKVTGLEPRMFGPSIVGFGEYAYQYASGHKGVAPAAGFSPRKAASVVYLSDGIAAHADALSELGPYTSGTSCLYLKDLGKVDLDVLARIVGASFAALTAGTFGNRARDAGSESVQDGGRGSETRANHPQKKRQS